MNANQPREMTCVGTCCSTITIIAVLILLVLDFISISNLSTYQTQINALNSYYVTCTTACGSSYSYDSSTFEKCCDYSGYCISKSNCISNKLYPLQSHYDSEASNIWI
jgi:hypothetical protein